MADTEGPVFKINREKVLTNTPIYREIGILGNWLLGSAD